MSLYFFDDRDPTKNKSEKIREKSQKKIQKKNLRKKKEGKNYLMVPKNTK